MIPAIVDASVAVKWFVEDVLSEQAVATINRYDFFAPSLILVETANGLWKYARRGDMVIEDCREAIGRLPGFVRTTPDEDLVEEAMALSVTFDHPAYDCLYLVLASRLSLPLLSADKRLLALATKSGGWRVIDLATLPPNGDTE
ncbi:MAG: type II toxin-antitoxin system VapC family toxin [Pseudomonadota bacterium]|nr:type II toxin-antitoxin system VapC family toxin [Pseudomonadota bacterium]